MKPLRGFLSDNASSAHPAVLEAVARANRDHAAPYGEDEITKRVERRFAELFGRDVGVFLTFNGTGANVLGISALLRARHEAVLCAEGAHVAVDEAGALERYAGVKLLTTPTTDGKLRPADVERHLARAGEVHAVQPSVVTITNATELGTVYTPSEVHALANVCRARGLRLHVDGARIANAAAAGHDLRALCEGASVLSFGGTKNGALGVEAVIIFDADVAKDFRFARKQGMQLASKGRFLAAQMDALLHDGLWLDNARHANRMAQLLARSIEAVAPLARPVEASAVYARLPRAAIAPLQARWPFYVWNEATNECRFVCSWDTSEEDVRAFADDVRQVIISKAA